VQLLTIREACEWLRISRATLYNLAKSGKIAFVKIGGKSLIRDDAIHRLIAQGSRARSQRPAGSPGTTWATLWDDLVRRGIVEPASRGAFLSPKLVPFRPVEVKGKPPSETIIQERGER
jgi:excisionase family DNA binding protein